MRKYACGDDSGSDGEAQYNYFEARRREMDTESNWSTNVQLWDEARERDRWSGLDYKAAHFTWTHKCYGRRSATDPRTGNAFLQRMDLSSL